MTRFGFGGETVGEAFIRIRASGANLPNDIRREFDKNEPLIEGLGERDSKAYAKGWKKQMKSRPTSKEMTDSIERALAEADVGDAFFRSKRWTRFKQDMKDQFGEAGALAARNLQKGFAEGGSFAELKARMRDVNREVAIATKQIQREEQRVIDEQARVAEQQKRIAEAAAKARERELKDLTREGNTVLRDLERVAAARKKLFATTDSSFARKDFERITSDIKIMGNGFRGASTNAQDMRIHIDRMKRVLDDLKTPIRRIGDGMSEVDTRVKDNVRDIGKFERGVRNLIKDIETHDIGRLFGKGARNDFFNIMGRIIGSLAEFASIALFKVILATTKWFSALKQVEGGLGKLNFVANTLVGGLLKLGVAAGTAFLAVGGLLELIAGPLVAGVADLAGLITALAATIGIGLVGAVAAVLPLLGVLGAGLGVFALAFAGVRKFSKEQKALLKERLKPIIDDYHQLRAVATKGLFSDLGNQVPLLHKFMEQTAIPLVRVASRTMAKALTGIFAVLSGPTARKNLDTLIKLIPDAGRRMGRIFGSLFNIIGGFLRAATPLTRQLLKALDDSLRSASKLINSAKGQSSLKKWLDGAWESAKKLWTTLKLLVKILFDILNAAKPTGDTFFDSINKSLDKFDKFLNSPRGQKALQGWMDQTKTFVTSFGQAVHGLQVLFNALNSATSQGILNALLKGIGLLGQGLAQVIPPFDKFLKIVTPTIVGIFKGFFSIVKDFFVFMDKHQTTAKVFAGGLAILFLTLKTAKLATALSTNLTNITNFATGLFTAATNIGKGFVNVVGAIRLGTNQVLTAKEKLGTAIAGIGLLISGGITTTQNTGLGGTIAGGIQNIAGGALTGFAIGGAPGAGIGAVIGGVATAIEHFWGRANQAAEEAKKQQVEALQAIQTEANLLATTLQDDANKIGKITKLTIGTTLAQIPKGATVSPLVAAQRLGISGNTLVDAITKGGPAFANVNKQLETMLGLGDKLEAQGHRLETRARLAPNLTADQRTALFTRASELFTRAQNARKLIPFIQEVLTALGGEKASLKLSIRTTDDAKAAAGQLNLATRDLATQTLAYKKVLDGNSVSAQRNRQFIKDHITAIEADAAANAKNRKAAESSANAILSQVSSFRQSLFAAHFNREEVNRLVKQYSHIPKKLITKLAADDTDAGHKIALMLFRKGLIAAPVLFHMLADEPAITRAKLASMLFQKGQISKDALFHVLADIPPDTRDKILTTLAQKGLITKQWLIRLVGKDEASDIISHVKGGLDSLHDKTIHIRVQSSSGRTPGVPLAAGGIFAGPQTRLIGEAGPEAVVPLNRPLSQIDPAVRWLAAYAQGLTNNTKTKPGGTVLAQKVTNIQPGAIIVTTPTTDPHAVAVETMNRLVARGGYG